MFEGKNWEVIFTIEKADKTKVKATPTEYFNNTPANKIIQIIKDRSKDLIDRYDFRSVEAVAVEIEWVDRSAGKVYYSTPSELHTFKLENEQNQDRD